MAATRLSVGTRRRIGKGTYEEIAVEMRRMQREAAVGKPFRYKEYGVLMRRLRELDQIAVRNGGFARMDTHDFDDWVRRRKERESAKAFGERINGTQMGGKTFCADVPLGAGLLADLSWWRA